MKIYSLLLITITAFCLGSCNTIAGIGKDISSVGSSVTNTAHKTSDSAQQKVSGVTNPQQQY